MPAYEAKADFWHFNVEADTWSHQISLPSMDKRGKLVSIQGILHYFTFPNYGQSLGYYLMNNTFVPLRDPPITFDFKKESGNSSDELDRN